MSTPAGPIFRLESMPGLKALKDTAAFSICFGLRSSWLVARPIGIMAEAFFIYFGHCS
jgi:hypothetical protein